MSLSVAQRQGRARSGTAVDDHPTGRVELRLVLGARGVGDELEQAAGHLDGALDVALPLHRLADVQEHGLAGRHLVRRVLGRHGFDTGPWPLPTIQRLSSPSVPPRTDARQYEVRLRVMQYLHCYLKTVMMTDKGAAAAAGIALSRPMKLRLEATRLRKRLDEHRRDDLLDAVMTIVAERGFSHVTIAELARELHCSAATLYKIAPSKDSLVLLAIARWADVTFFDMEARSAKGKTASERARVYFRVGAERTRAAVADVLRGHGALRIHAPRLVDKRRRALHRPFRRAGPAARRRPARSGR